MANDLDPSLSDNELAAALLRQAGTLALEMRAHGLTGERKTSISDVVTAADKAAEAWLLGQLRRCRPEDGILGEEGASHHGSSGRVWVLDPVDGTYNFLSGSSYWCSALALVARPASAPGAGTDDDAWLADAEPLLGAVYQPQEDSLWLGGIGVPATRNGVPLPAIDDNPAAQISAGTYIHPGWLSEPRAAGPWTAAALLPATLRMFGSGSCDLARVAQGQLGCWFQHSCPPWDWQPGKALVHAAGGDTAVVRVNGLDWCVAGPPTAVREVSAALRSGALPA
ncbi:inositol monophosphatase family protein [Arthrobacter sp. 35W]|uniref:inositol monophosphatase family protein n=1 Tax=Arthrobacter sp. 35W TaxID=1132441 RepID=UPI00040425B7|nr:inositol monophosphatase family protein [Arthrobacter sp. 35W]